MKNSCSLVIAAALLGLSLSAAAVGVTNSTTIGPVTSTNYGVVLFTVAQGAIGGTPGCNTNQRFAFDSAVAGNKPLVLAVAQASAAGKTIVAVGSGACSVDGSSETLVNLTVYP